MLADTHCHLDFNRFDNDRQAVLERAAKSGVIRILVPGINLTSSQVAISMADHEPILYSGVGIHPNDASMWNKTTLERLRTMATHPKVVAIGEIGLDYYRNRSKRDQQKQILREQLNLATELEIPVVLHLREEADAHDGGACAEELLIILEEWVQMLQANNSRLAKQPGVLHAFGGSLETARQAIRLGFFIGVAGPVTFHNAKKRQEIVAALPLEYLLIETDAPFLTPHPYRGQRNEPANVSIIADKIGQLHSCHPEQVAVITSNNAARLFSWGETY